MPGRIDGSQSRYDVVARPEHYNAIPDRTEIALRTFSEGVQFGGHVDPVLRIHPVIPLGSSDEIGRVRKSEGGRPR